MDYCIFYATFAFRKILIDTIMADKVTYIDPSVYGSERYINPYTDFGFKKLFGTEMNKDLLISFLNALFDNKRKRIVDIEYINPENLGDGYGDRRSVFDV